MTTVKNSAAYLPCSREPKDERLAAAERHVEVDAGGRQVDHHHAGFRIALEMRRVLEAGRGDAGRQAERRVVGGGSASS